MTGQAGPLRISAAESQVMTAVWAEGEGPEGIGGAGVEQILAAVGPANGWGESTVRTLIHRLIRKGALRFRAEGKRYLYSPAVSRDACVRSESRSFLWRVFGGAVGPMLAHFRRHAAALSRLQIAGGRGGCPCGG